MYLKENAMKKAVILIMVCLLLVGWKVTGYCQDQGGSDDSAIEQSESQVSQGLDSEIDSDRSQAEGEVGQVDSSMSTGGD